MTPSTSSPIALRASPAWRQGLGGLTRSGSSVEALAWALYDFATTIFSFAIGLYGLVGKFSAVIGPLIYGIIVATLLASLDRAAYQVAIGSLFVLLMVGIWILRGVPEGEPENEEAGMSR